MHEHRHRRPWALLIGLGIFAFAAAGLGIVAGGPTAAESLANAVVMTQAQHTADFTLSGHFHFPHVNLQVRAKGTVDFAASAEKFRLFTTHTGLTSKAVVVTAGGITYEDRPTPDNPMGRKPWTASRMDRGGSITALDALSFGVKTILRVFTDPGATVVSLGTSMKRGQQVDGYQVTVDSAAIKTFFSVTSFGTEVHEAVTRDISRLTFSSDIYVDRAGEVQSADLTYQFDQKKGYRRPRSNVIFKGALSLRNEGVPTNITSPPESTVMKGTGF